MEKKKVKVIVLYETVLQSWLRDAGTFVMVLALIGVGVWLESSPMQWVGAIMFFIALVVRAVKVGEYMTVEEAREHLDELEKEMRTY